MAIYSTFFLCAPDQLHEGFPNWKPPLPEAVKRKAINPFTGEERVINTREPEWEEFDLDEMAIPELEVVSGKGDYQRFLAERIPPSVKSLPHWCSKNLTSLELEPLVCAVIGEEEPKLEYALYAPPTVGSSIERFPEEFVASLKEIDDAAVDAIAERWAAIMSMPEYTHSVSGKRIYEDWAVEDALALLRPIIELAKRHTEGQGMYLLTEF